MDYGYKLGKPYVLKIFDAEAQSCITSQTFRALCQIMMVGGEIATALGQACSVEEIEMVTRSRLVSAV
eukprot:2614257-Karenia_brevis.AAC.1